MAPVRKTHTTPFTIHCDEPEDSTYAGVEENALESYQHSSLPNRADSPIESIESLDSASTTESSSAHNFSSTDTSSNESENDGADNAQQKEAYSPRRTTSNITRTSISSLPDSALPSEAEQDDAYTPTRPRPSFRASSIRRYHASSPSSDRLRLSPRPSSLFSTRARSLRSATIRASPRPRTRERQEEKDRLAYPLVLLHVTLLPATLPWGARTLLDVLPVAIRERLALLRSKSTETVLQRGILVPHPQDDFEVLEERVLEALELVEGRIGRSGEFRPRRDGWSGGSILGLYGNDEDEAIKEHELGEQDGHSNEGSPTYGDQVNKTRAWDVRVYAANGLMRAGAWAAAWNEMERVDVEVVPFIPDGIRARLDEVQAEEDQMVVERRLQEEAEAAAMAAEQRAKNAMYEPCSVKREGPLEPMQRRTTTELIPQTYRQGIHRQRQIVSQEIQAPAPKEENSLPAAYRPKEVPLDVLVRNYLYLLAQDRRNLAIIFLVVMVSFSSLHGMLQSKPNTTLGVYDDFPVAEIHVANWTLQNDTDDELNLDTGETYSVYQNATVTHSVGGRECLDATKAASSADDNNTTEEPREMHDFTWGAADDRIPLTLETMAEDKQYKDLHDGYAQEHDAYSEQPIGPLIVRNSAMYMLEAVSGALDAMSEDFVE